MGKYLSSPSEDAYESPSKYSDLSIDFHGLHIEQPASQSPSMKSNKSLHFSSEGGLKLKLKLKYQKERKQKVKIES
jgi:Cu/Zn superoxide dismutase